jgi:hypothetical protein
MYVFDNKIDRIINYMVFTDLQYSLQRVLSPGQTGAEWQGPELWCVEYHW